MLYRGCKAKFHFPLLTTVLYESEAELRVRRLGFSYSYITSRSSEDRV